jgi:V8-like Glu-specific endopeptidase
MKKLLVATYVTLLSFVSISQHEPFGFSLSEQMLENLSTKELSTFDHATLLEEDTRREQLGQRSNFGRIIPLEVNQESEGKWTTLPNGDRLWQFRFHTENAKGVSVYFNDLFLPIGSTLYLYPANRKYFVGPFSNEDCNTHGHFVAGEVAGDEAILEYYEPADVVGLARIGIRGIAHLYRFVPEFEEESRGGGSEPCEVDVNCPEGAEWTSERDAVVRLTISEGALVGFCSGTLMNTTAKDCRKYILTALHCGENVSDADWLDCSVRFNYESSGCASGSTTTTRNKIGVLHLADSNDGGGQTGSDFLLLEMEDEIPASWTPFFAGWNASTSAANTGVSIHHPAGDKKKISTTDDIISGTYSAPGFHWRVKWMETITNWGVTEPGSSGSPLFDQNHFVVGTLTGGVSFCDSPNGSDWYGKMSKHWTANPNTSDQKLKEWLDPEDTGLFQFGGSYKIENAAFPCDPAAINVNEFNFEDMQIFPSIADQAITISTARYAEVEEIRIFDQSGKLLSSTALKSARESVDITNYAAGLYYVTFVGYNGNFVTKKFAVAH